jgi:hypothetical protein
MASASFPDPDPRNQCQWFQNRLLTNRASSGVSVSLAFFPAHSGSQTLVACFLAARPPGLYRGRYVAVSHIYGHPSYIPNQTGLGLVIPCKCNARVV